MKTLRQAGTALRLTFRNRGARGVIGVTTVAYLLGYLYAIETLQAGDGRFGVVVASEPTVQLFRRTFGTFTYEPVALFRLGVVTYQFSLNTVLGLALASLVGLNLGVSYLAWRQPAACGIGSRSAGALAGIPALLSGSACCAPVVVILLGVQLTGGLLLAFELLVPIAVLLLVGTLLLIARQIDPERAGAVH
ncbi:hypothetical protein RH858_00560 [Halalkaliarchaeum sp. AArc-GB]|uniref:hypothetical protein n=1 Tax=unclassified Halalkaliarchaeum TaxID=2678344 RepID=UPI00217DEF16|nr:MULTISPECIES: hypothetical protein [unclassified Halalkaliarchaeum]MDR5671647.1 hypothetical protein [Halalkaliarchaeum sp. AArc-GB]